MLKQVCTRGPWRALALAVVVAGLAATASAQETVLQATTPIWPDRIAVVLPDGTLGPWMVYQLPSEPRSAQAYAPIWDTYEADPTTWNNVDNVACEYYQVGPNRDQYCNGPCFANRYRWCQRGLPSCPSGPYAVTCMAANGGNLAANPPPEAQVMTLLWGASGDPAPLEIEITFFGIYAACNDPGSGDPVSGVVLGFDPPNAGFYRTTVDLLGEGIPMLIPDTGRIGIQFKFWENRENEVVSTHADVGLWFTKTGYEPEMGKDDPSGFSDHHGNPQNDCVLGPSDCVRSSSVCPPTGDNIVGPAVLLLGEGVGDTCIYKASKAAKAKGGCETCPQKNDRFSSGVECQGPNNCTAKVKGLTIDCPGGGDGSCTKVKGKRLDCGTP